MAAGDFARAEAIIGQGKKLEWADTANATTWNKIGGTRSIQFPQRKVGGAEVTNDDSANRTKDYIPGIIEPGTATASYVYGKTIFAAVEALVALSESPATAATATKYWRVTLPDGSKEIYQGFVTSNDINPEIEDEVVADLEIQVTGKPAFTAGP